MTREYLSVRIQIQITNDFHRNERRWLTLHVSSVTEWINSILVLDRTGIGTVSDTPLDSRHQISHHIKTKKNTIEITETASTSDEHEVSLLTVIAHGGREVNKDLKREKGCFISKRNDFHLSTDSSERYSSSRSLHVHVNIFSFVHLLEPLSSRLAVKFTNIDWWHLPWPSPNRSMSFDKTRCFAYFVHSSLLIDRSRKHRIRRTNFGKRAANPRRLDTDRLYGP